MRCAILVLTLALTAEHALAQHAGHGATPQQPSAQPYAGQQSRSVSSLSPEDTQGFLAGKGMGLAKPAELNGFPGPMHVLELEAQLQLSATQKTAVQKSFATMQAKAKALGQRYVSAEAAVDEAFKTNANAAVVSKRVAAANKLLGEIRMAHLAAHLEITPLLTAQQRAKYAELRGYTGGGHDMSKHKH